MTKYDLSSVRILGCGAAPLGKEHIEALQLRMPAQLKQGYGMTETTSGVISQQADGGTPGNKKLIIHPKHALLTSLVSIGSIGVIYPNIEAKIVDVDSGKGKDSW